MNVEVVETTEETVTGGPELWVIVSSNEIHDLPQVLTEVSKEFPEAWMTYDKSRPRWWLPDITPEERKISGFRFHDYWIFPKIVRTEQEHA